MVNEIRSAEASAVQNSTEEAIATNLRSKYANAIKLVLWGGLFAMGVAVAQSAYEKAYKPDQAELMYRELTVQMIESGKWEDTEAGVVWAIAYTLKNEGDDKVKQAVFEAKVRENFILRFHNIQMTPGRDGIFPMYFEFTKDNLLLFPELYENVLDLYLMRHPEEDRDAIGKSASIGKAIRIEFSPDYEKGRYYIRHIDLVEKPLKN